MHDRRGFSLKHNEFGFICFYDRDYHSEAKAIQAVRIICRRQGRIFTKQTVDFPDEIHPVTSKDFSKKQLTNFIAYVSEAARGRGIDESVIQDVVLGILQGEFDRQSLVQFLASGPSTELKD